MRGHPSPAASTSKQRRALQAAAVYATLLLAVRRLSLNLVKTALTYVAVFSAGAVTSVSCFEPDLENPSFRCSPKAAAINPDDACPQAEAGSVEARSPGSLVSAMFKLQVVVHSRLWTGKRQQAAAVQGDNSSRCRHSVFSSAFFESTGEFSASGFRLFDWR